MTRIVVGVDPAGTQQPAVDMVERLRFPEPHLNLVHVAPDRLTIPTAFGITAEVEGRYAEISNRIGQTALAEATTKISGHGIPCEAFLAHGNTAENLIAEAERIEADLIAVNTKRIGVTCASYVGSVGRALAIGSGTSVLLTKGHQGKRATFRAVFAVDHSPFSLRCLDRFLEMAPQGLEEVHLVTAWDINDREAEILGRNLTMLGGDADRWIEETIRERNFDLCQRVEEAGYRPFSRVVRGKPTEVIHHAMAAIRADLLVVGSQGCGAMSKNLLGSVSLHHATVEFFPVLIVRPSEKMKI